VRPSGPDPLTGKAREALEKMTRGELTPPDATRVDMRPAPRAPVDQRPVDLFELFGMEISALQARPWEEIREQVQAGEKISIVDEAFYSKAREYVARLATSYPLAEARERIDEAVTGIEMILTGWGPVLPEEVKEELRRVREVLSGTKSTGSSSTAKWTGSRSGWRHSNEPSPPSE
jgi:hypothetical protein